MKKAASEHPLGSVPISVSPPPLRKPAIFPPWDLLRGRCVFKDGKALGCEVGKADLTHWAPNCSTFSRAREIPIPGVKCPPRPLRSETYPMGIAEELNRMSPKSRKRLMDDTTMANMSADWAHSKHKKGRYFTLEHPARSLALHLDSWSRLLSCEGVGGRSNRCLSATTRFSIGWERFVKGEPPATERGRNT